MDAHVVASAVHAASAVVGNAMHAASIPVASAAHQASAAAAAVDTFPCLGIRALGQCQYNPLKPNNSYLTLGDALAALGLVIAFLQLGTPAVRLRNRIRTRVIRLAFALFVLVFVFTGYAALIPSLYSNPLESPMGVPVVFEIAGALSGLIAFVTVAYSYFQPTKFTRRNAREFAQACHYTLATGDTDALRALSVEIGRNIDRLVEAASAGVAATYLKTQPLEHQKIAFQLLQMLSDRRFCQVVVESSPETFVGLVEELKSHHASRDVARPFLRQLSASAFLSDSSFLAKEGEEYAGLGHYGMYTRSIYGDYGFATQRVELFDGWKSYLAEEVTRGSTERYCRAFRTMFEGYFQHKDFHSYPHALHHAFENMWEVFRSQMWELSGVREEGVYRTQAYKVASAITDTYVAVYDLIAKNQSVLPTNYLEESDNLTFGDSSVYLVFAKAFFELIEGAAEERGHDESVRFMLYRVYEGVRGRFGGPAIPEIQRRLRKLLADKLRENMVDGYYPFVSRPLCNLVGIWDSANVPDSDARVGFMTRAFHDALRSYFWSAYLTDPDKAQELLADYVTFDGETGELVQTSRYGNKSIMKLERPAEPLKDTAERFGRIKRVR
ncbi:hypothetical protein [Burkholderia pseudomallei]|uniref:hypothetical protein n=1 Tax=Burkholderia pseudomallei TaxID=28450 RepID=UPI001177BD0F|nr:hypothetical protein [Burkholderia pseudomallei]